MTSPADPSDSEYVVLRPTIDLADSDMPRSVEGEWRRRADLADQDAIELLGPAGIVHAYPTTQNETAPDGSEAQVYEVPTSTVDADHGDE